jgi:hypothetical protein
MGEIGKVVEGQRVVVLNSRHILEPTAIIGIVTKIDGESVIVRYDNNAHLDVSIASVFPIQNSHALHQFV